MWEVINFEYKKWIKIRYLLGWLEGPDIDSARSLLVGRGEWGSLIISVGGGG